MKQLGRIMVLAALSVVMAATATLAAEPSKRTAPQANEIGIRKSYAGDFTWMGAESALEAKCLAERTSGFYVSAGTQDELAQAFHDTLGCSVISAR